MIEFVGVSLMVVCYLGTWAVVVKKACSCHE
jgi:hypothetical protein